IGGGIAPYGSGSGGEIGANGEFVGHKTLHAALGHDHEDDIGGVGAELHAEAAARKTNWGRGAPTAGSAATREAAPILTAEEEGGLLHAWHNNEALRVFEEFARDSAVGCRHDVTKSGGAVLQAFVGRFLLRGEESR